MANGESKAVKELEKEQKSRTVRMVHDSIDGALFDLATFYRDVMMMQSGISESMIYVQIRKEFESYVTSCIPNATILKIESIMDACTNLLQNVVPLATSESLMCQLARN